MSSDTSAADSASTSEDESDETKDAIKKFFPTSGADLVTRKSTEPSLSLKVPRAVAVVDAFERKVREAARQRGSVSGPAPAPALRDQARSKRSTSQPRPQVPVKRYSSVESESAANGLPSPSSRRSPPKTRIRNSRAATPQKQITPSQSQTWNLMVPVSNDPFRHSAADSSLSRYQINHDEEKQKLLAQLEVSTNPIKTRLPDVERYFGQTGFSEFFRVDEVNLRYEEAASRKQRKVNRDGVSLNRGEAWTAPTDNNRGELALIHPIQQAHDVLTARFKEPHNPRLTFANTISNRHLNGKFQFLDSYIFGTGVRTAPPSKKHSCSCAGDSCAAFTCPCLLHSIEEARSGQTQRVVTYTQRPDGLIVLDESYMANELTPSAAHFEISECTQECACAASGFCTNRLVTEGRTVPLEIFETAKCGFGVRSPVDIVKGQFIDLYLGEVITQVELERRENAKEENASSYIYSLDWFTQQQTYHVDGENFGTAMRFVNHCCSPNARNFTVQTNKNDKHVYYLAFFAIKDVPAGTEICIDYSPQEDVKDVPGDPMNGFDNDEAEQDGRARCYCGAGNCRKFLWRSAGRKRKKRKTTKHD
jgi:[histone H3]-lysine9 N-trimethyltransferase SUV39H